LGKVKGRGGEGRGREGGFQTGKFCILAKIYLKSTILYS
jgi:hypothetical protein